MLAIGVQFGLYRRILHEPLNAQDIERARPALTLWLKLAIGWQVLVLVLSGVYLSAMGGHHGSGIAWTAPAIGAIVGTALPLQFVVVGIMRAARK